MPDDLDLLVVGSIALDRRDGPFGKVDEELGGSAVYFALAASLVLPVKVSAPVGKDAIETVSKVFDGHDIDMSRVKVFGAPTYRWTAHQEHGRTVDLGSADEIYDHWQPELPEGFAGWAFVGSMRPDRQVAAITALRHPARLLAADAMLSYVRLQPDEAVDVLRRSSWFFCNHEEYLAFGAGDPEEFRRRWFLDGLVLKSGAAGVTAYTANGEVQIPGLRGHPHSIPSEPATRWPEGCSRDGCAQGGARPGCRTRWCAASPAHRLRSSRSECAASRRPRRNSSIIGWARYGKA